MGTLPGDTVGRLLLLVSAGCAGAPPGPVPALEEAGLSLEFAATHDVLANVSGGARRDTAVLGNLDFLLAADLGTLLGWYGARALLYGLGNYGESISRAVGDLQGVSNIEAPRAFKLYEAWIEQRFWNERASVLLGLYDLNSELDVIPAAGLFLHSSHGVGA